MVHGTLPKIHCANLVIVLPNFSFFEGRLAGTQVYSNPEPHKRAHNLVRDWILEVEGQ